MPGCCFISAFLGKLDNSCRAVHYVVGAYSGRIPTIGAAGARRRAASARARTRRPTRGATPASGRRGGRGGQRRAAGRGARRSPAATPPVGARDLLPAARRRPGAAAARVADAALRRRRLRVQRTTCRRCRTSRGRAATSRFAAGGAWRWRRFAFDAEIPFVNVTTHRRDRGAEPGAAAARTRTRRRSRSATSRWARTGPTALVGREALVGGLRPPRAARDPHHPVRRFT